MFCDFDDMFTNIYALRDILSVLPCECDMMWTQLLVEDRTDGKDLLYRTPETQRFVFIHGKVYRRQFLIDQKIRFDEGMPFQEDSLFNAVITARADFRRIGQIKTQADPYVWIRRENSVTNSGRSDEATYWHFRRNLKVTAENEKDPVKYAGMVTRTAYDTYFMCVGRRVSPKMKKRIGGEFAPWIREKAGLFGQVTEEIMTQIIGISRGELLEADERVPEKPEYVKDWIKEITREEK